MSKIDKTGQTEMEELQKIGLEFNAPQDEYSYQSASGSITGGILGEQEYGIESDEDHVESEIKGIDGEVVSQEQLMSLPGESQWSLEQGATTEEKFDDEVEEFEIDDDDLQELIAERIANHPNLLGDPINIYVENSEVVLEGKVRSESEKVRVSDLVAAMPGVVSILNNLEIQRAPS